MKLSKSDYAKATGLLMLAKKHMDQLQDIERALAEIFHEPEDEYGGFGHVTDAIYSNYSVENLTRKITASRGKK